MPTRRRSLLPALVLGSARVPALLGHAVRAVLNGLWLGALSDAAIRAVDERYYERESAYRTAEWNARGLFAWEAEVIERHLAPGARVVVPACGGGREVLALLRDGFDATGHEPHPALASYAETFLAGHGHPGRARLSARDAFPDGATGDAVLVGWGALSLIAGRDRRVAFLTGARAALPAGGPVVVSFFHRPALGRELRATAALARLLRRLRGGGSVEAGDTLAPNRVHVFTPEAFAAEAAAAGLELVEHRVVGPAGEDVDYACAVVRVP